MGKAKLISLQKVFWRFLIILISGLFLSVAIPFLLLSLASSAGYVTYANNAEHYVQKISPIIAAAPDITKVAIPSYCEYLILDTDYNILYTNMDVTEQSIKIYKNWRKQWPHKQDAISIHTVGRRILCVKILCRLTV